MRVRSAAEATSTAKVVAPAPTEVVVATHAGRLAHELQLARARLQHDHWPWQVADVERLPVGAAAVQVVERPPVWVRPARSRAFRISLRATHTSAILPTLSDLSV